MNTILVGFDIWAQQRIAEGEEFGGEEGGWLR